MQALVPMVALALCQSKLVQLPMCSLLMCQGVASHQVVRSRRVTLQQQARPPLYAVASLTPLQGLLHTLLRHRDHRRGQGSAVVSARPLQLPARTDLPASVLHTRTQHRSCHVGPRRTRGCALQPPAGKRLCMGRGGVALRLPARLLYPPPEKRKPPKPSGCLAHGHASASLYTSFTLGALKKQSPLTPLSLQQRQGLPAWPAP